MTEAKPHIEIHDLTVRYSDHVWPLCDIDLLVSRGDFVFLCGSTGAGKSTLLKVLYGEVPVTSGSARVGNWDLTKVGLKQVPGLRKEMGIVPQDFGLLPRKTIFENVAYAMRANGATKRETRRRVPEILDRVNVSHRADAYPNELSGGEQQRVAIGRALINNPALLLADEPTGNLDPEHSWEIMQLLANLNLRGTTVIVASHDMMVVERMGKRIIQLDHGRIVSDTHNNLEPAPLPGFFKEHSTEDHDDYSDEDTDWQNPRASQEL